MEAIRTILILLMVVYLTFSIYWIVILGFKKTWAINRYALVYLVLFPAQILCLLFPIAWLLRGLGKWNPFWIVMDDTRFEISDKNIEDGFFNVYANDYWVYIQDRNRTEETFKIAIEWHIRRNRVWNLQEIFSVPKTDFKLGNNDIHVTDFEIDNLYKNNKEKTRVIQDGIWVSSAGLKYIPKRPEDDPYQVNSGDIISIKTSILGTGYIWYTVGRWFSFRYSQCRIVKYPFIKPYYRTVRFGTNGSRYQFTLKHQNIKPWK